MSQEVFYRSIAVDRSAIDLDNRTVAVSFSSEKFYQRSFGLEVLSHNPADVDMSFISSGNAPALVEHDVNQQVGVVEQATIESGVGRAIVRVSKSEDGEKVWQDIVDGIRKNVSVGYIITDRRQEQRNGTQVVVCKWAPKEISFVALPVDESIGVCRSATADLPAENKDQNNNKETQMENTEKDVAVQARAEQAIDVQAIIKTERSRADEITNMARSLGLDEIGVELVKNGKSLDEARSIFLNEVSKKSAPVQTSMAIGLSEKEAKQFSLSRAIDALNAGNLKNAGFEYEVSSEVAKRSGKTQTANNVFIPTEYSYRAAGANATTVADNPSLVNQTTLGLVDMLYRESIAGKLGARVVTGLNGTVDFKRILSGATARKVAEGVDGTVDKITSDKIVMNPEKRIALVELTDSMLRNTTAMESYIQAHLIKKLNEKIDADILASIVATDAISWITKPTNTNFKDIQKLITTVAKFDALTDAAKFAADYDILEMLSVTLHGDGTTTNTAGKTLIDDAGRLNKREIVAANQVGNNLIFGDFSNVVAGFWGTVELAVDPYAKFNSGGIVLRAMVDMDSAVLQEKAFAGYKALI